MGPATFDIRSPFRAPVEAARRLYAEYPQGSDDEIFDFAVAAVPTVWWRRWYRRSMTFRADYMMEDIVPIEERLGLLGFEMAVNMQMALGYRRDIVLHAASAAQGDRAIIIVGDSGAGKSTLSALLSYSAGWRHLGDELALIAMDDPITLKPYPRPIGLKNQSIAVMRERVDGSRFGPELTGTMKGTVRHLLPPAGAIANMDVPARPALIVSPHFAEGVAPRTEQMSQSEAYMRLSVASTNQLQLGEPGFDTLIRLVREVPAYDLHYSDSEDALKLVADLWAKAG
ncbi:HprK-related kinase A [Pacificimonas sp. WHA3]|uniref:HprK-related kinase A n=1 Tax=Pacificimonas pallii TaxID=2827236 RepID=A0ABS6SEH4_9SPHN|nr:HprK-related kinase A [Pacificimonas pallii]